MNVTPVTIRRDYTKSLHKGGSHPSARACATIRYPSATEITFPLIGPWSWRGLLSNRYPGSGKNYADSIVPSASEFFTPGLKNCNGEARTGIRLAARTIAGAHIREAAPPMRMFLRVIR